jgi:hypothetical protein
MRRYRQNNLFVAFTMPWWRSEGEGKENRALHRSIDPSPASATRKRKSPNTPNGVRAIVYPTREINTVNSPTLAMTQRRKGTTKYLKCKAGRVRNPGSQCGLRSETDSRQRFHIKTKPTPRPKVPVAAILCKK